jgi:chorismate-pyruvate lyase
MNDWGHAISPDDTPLDAGKALAAHLAASPSVTAGLLAWCEARGLGEGPIRIVARSGGSPPPRLASLLGAGPEERVAFRRVVLGRGAIALAEADNLFLPGRLPPEMREALAATDTPFGTVIAPLGPVRQTIAITHGAAAGPGVILRQEALVLSPSGPVLAAVSERFLFALAGR